MRKVGSFACNSHRLLALSAKRSQIPSVIASTAANGYQVKTGQRKVPERRSSTLSPAVHASLIIIMRRL